MDHRAHLAEALVLAERGRGTASPNPMVGALVVKGRRVLGRGFHRARGEAHAEVRALRQAGDAASGSTLYVNLEPCAHHGRTPPCVDAILRSGVRRVVASMKDPNPLVRGRGFAALRRAGVDVECGLLGAQARDLNEAYVHYVHAGRPFVLLKAGATLDGRIAIPGAGTRWITSPEARREAHRLRWGMDAILVGIGTVLADDPELAARRAGRERGGFVRAVLDSRLRTPIRSRLVQAAGSRPTIIYTTARAPATRERALTAAGVLVKRIPGRSRRVALGPVLRDLGRREVSSLLVEGGGEVHASFLAARKVEKVLLFVAPLLAGGRGVPLVAAGSGRGPLARLRRVQVDRCGPDLRIVGYPAW
jgi:diaminohydroxyphosphoribosylaminopyrimidine deaminase/5-amino-6-(5-phosphoribosylamino)uracil reductase